ncbi:DUF4394 domain-containing protein [Corticibacterium sp. UT-5YL-CI-8]|nr:DUF4394 domain-containing protein [Tianweitania sp. UT-5YL-CI-8]
MNRIASKLVLAGPMLVSLTAMAAAAPALGLTGEKTLIWFDTDKPAETKTIEVTGVDRLHGIDLRAADKMVYGVAGDGSLVSLNLDTGAATVVSKLSKLPPEGGKVSVDFNPMADKLRVMASDGTNLRADPASGAVTEDGKLAYEAGDPSAAMKPNVIATAYTNSFGKPEKTGMYDIEASGLLLQQTKPNDGTLKTIGSLGVTLGDSVGFDIQTIENGTNTAWLATGGALYKVNIETGKAEKAGDVDAGFRDLTVLP